MKIMFNKADVIGNEYNYIHEAMKNGAIKGDGPFTQKCHQFLEQKLGSPKVLLTHSCTAALEMSALLADLQAGDEVIMPSYTFVSTANAFVLRGAIPVFVDIRKDTLNMDETKIEAAISPKTKAIVVVHYAGVACEMDAICEIAKRHKLLLIEDAAQALGSFYKGKAVGTFGDMACFSFHETKNILSGEGGALCINNEKFIKRSEIIREKGTNRAQFFRGEVDKYTWVDLGSSYLPSDMVAAFLFAQLENMDTINHKRLEHWYKYHTFFENFEKLSFIRRPFVPENCLHNAHMYYILFPSLEARTKCIDFLKEKGISSVFHYVPLHSSPAGRRFAKVSGDMTITEKYSDRLLRLPMYYGLSGDEMAQIQSSLTEFFTAYSEE